MAAFLKGRTTLFLTKCSFEKLIKAIFKNKYANICLIDISLRHKIITIWEKWKTQFETSYWNKPSAIWLIFPECTLEIKKKGKSNKMEFCTWMLHTDTEKFLYRWALKILVCLPVVNFYRIQIKIQITYMYVSLQRSLSQLMYLV